MLMHNLFFKNLLPGTVLFKKYELLECLSSSHLGGVYKCRCVSDPSKLIALKVLSTAAATDDHLRLEFEREVRLSFSVSHPNVVCGIDYSSDDDFTAFAMEYAEGGTLADYLEKKGRLSVPEILSILTQVARGLNAIHSQGIIHRDLKPENVLIESSGAVKIADFGIAVHEVEPDATVTREQLKGTVNYLSPEYIRNGECDARADIYALGVIAYELITGALPFGGASLVEALTARVCSDPVSPRFVRPEIPRALSDLALKAMKRDPARRYQSAQEVLAHLDMIDRLEIVEAEETSGPVFTRREPLSGIFAKVSIVPS